MPYYFAFALLAQLLFSSDFRRYLLAAEGRICQTVSECHFEYFMPYTALLDDYFTLFDDMMPR